MKKILVILVLCTWWLPAHAGKERLIGTWKSNRAATLEYLKKNTHLNTAQLQKLGPVLGTMVIIFDEETVTFQQGDWKVSSKYTIYNEFPTAIMIQSENPRTKKIEKSRLDIDATGFWAPDDIIPGYKERFDKQPPTEAEKATIKEATKGPAKEATKVASKESSKAGSKKGN